MSTASRSANAVSEEAAMRPILLDVISAYADGCANEAKGDN